MKVYYPYVCSVDWLQLYCLRSRDISDTEKIAVVKREYGTKIFSCAADMFLKDVDGKRINLGSVCWSPRSSAINSSAVTVKFHNSLLYVSNWFQYVKLVIDELKLEYKGVTRIDLAYDCNKLKNGLLPLSLINKYLSKQVLKIGNNSPVVNYKSLGYIIGLAINKETKQQAVELKENEINAVTFGQKSSGVQCQIYNKSLEMKLKYKSWIVEEWERSGLDKEKVWRFEIRIQGRGKDLLEMETGEIFQLGLNDLVNQDKIDRLFMSYAYNYFRFVKRDYHVKKQQMKTIDLFSFKFGETNLKHKIIKTQTSGSLGIKMALNALIRVEKLVEKDGLSNFDVYGKVAFQDLISTLIRLYSYDDLRVKSKASKVGQRIAELIRRQGFADKEIIEKINIFNRDEI